MRAIFYFFLGAAPFLVTWWVDEEFHLEIRFDTFFGFIWMCCLSLWALFILSKYTTSDEYFPEDSPKEQQKSEKTGSKENKSVNQQALLDKKIKEKSDILEKEKQITHLEVELDAERRMREKYKKMALDD